MHTTMLSYEAPARRTATDKVLAGKSVVVTGSTSGIGLAIAEALGAEGANVLFNGFGDMRAVEALRAGLESRFGIKTGYSPADMSKPGEISEMMQLAQRTFGAVDIVVNNAGVQHVEAVETFPPARWDQILAINLSAAFHTTQAAVPGMKARRWGRIINVASAHALVASPYKSAYVAAKHGILGLTRTVALETAEHGITVNAICPGYVLTPLVEKQIPETARARNLTEAEVIRDVLLHAQPTRAFIMPEEIGALAVFLCTNLAKSITGAALPVDGGWTAQ